MASPLTLLTFVLTLAALSLVQGNGLPSGRRRAFGEGYSYSVAGRRVTLLMPGFEGRKAGPGLPPTPPPRHAPHLFLPADGDRLPARRPGLRKKRFGPPKYRFGPPKYRFTPWKDQLTANDGFSQPRDQHEPPKDVFSLDTDRRVVLPNDQIGAPIDEIGVPIDEIGEASDEIGEARDQFSALPDQSSRGEFPSKDQSLPHYPVHQPKDLSLQPKAVYFGETSCPHNVFALCDNCAIRNPQYFLFVHKSCCGQNGYIRMLCQVGYIF